MLIRLQLVKTLKIALSSKAIFWRKLTVELKLLARMGGISITSPPPLKMFNIKKKQYQCFFYKKFRNQCKCTYNHYNKTLYGYDVYDMSIALENKPTP
jgi:hypothetical protein